VVAKNSGEMLLPVTLNMELSRREAGKIIDCLVNLGVFEAVKAYLIAQKTSDGWDVTDAPIGTEYIAYRGSEQYMIHGQEGRVPKRRWFIWVRGGVSNDLGKMPVELFRFEDNERRDA
jgi:hypothetical protein